MKIRNKLALALAFSSTLISGCMTANMWESASKSHTTYLKERIGTDTIYAFGQAQKATNQIRNGSLVMMGDRYWYVLPPHASQKFLHMLRGGLPRAYVITTPDANSAFNVMPVNTVSEQGQFTSNFCLNYTATTAQEKNTLSQLHFTKNSDHSSTYRSCFDISGQYYNAANSVPAEYQFEAPIAVALSKKKAVSTIVNPLKIGGAMLLTPLTLAGDTIASILILPSVMATTR